MQESEKIWMNGELVDWHEAKVHVLSHALHYGSGVFEGIRAYATDRGPAVFRLREHLERLRRSGEVYFLELPYSTDELRAAVHETLAANELETCYVRPIVFRGYGEMGINPLNCPVDVVIAVWPWGAYLGEEALEHGVRVGISSWRRIGPNTVPAAAKASGQYLNSQLAKLEAMKSGYDEAILLNEQGYLADGSGENVFVIRDGVLATPPVTASCLPGITRDTVIRIGRELGLRRAGARRRAHRPVPRRRAVLHAAPPPRSRRSAPSTTTRSAPGRSRRPSRRSSSRSPRAATRSPTSTSTTRRRRRCGRSSAPRRDARHALAAAGPARHRRARGGVRPRRAALGRARPRPVHAALRGGLRGLPRHALRGRGVERDGRSAPRGADRRDRPRRRGDHHARSPSWPRPTRCCSSAGRRSSPTSTSAPSTSTPTRSRRPSRRGRRP